MARKESVSAGELDRDELARLLREAAEAHHEYEQRLGRPDEDWPKWYAEYIIDKLVER